MSANAPVVDQNVSATLRMEMAVERGEALSVVLLLSFIYLFIVLFFSCQMLTCVCHSIFWQQVSMKHLVKSLQCHLAKPDCTFYGLFSAISVNLLKNNLNLY